MDKKIIVFSGMPVSGKDTVTDKICEFRQNVLDKLGELEIKDGSIVPKG